MRRQEERQHGDQPVQRGGEERRAFDPEPSDQEGIAQQGPRHRTQRVPAVEPPEDVAEALVPAIDRGHQDRQGDAHRGGGNQHQEESDPEPQRIEQGRLVDEWTEDRGEQRGQLWQQENEPGPRNADHHLEPGVDRDRAPDPMAEATGDSVAEGQPCHEAGQHQARSPDRIAERQPRLEEPQRFEE